MDTVKPPRLFLGMATPRTQNFIKGLSPVFRKLAIELLEVGYQAGMNPQVSSGYRTPDEQDALYAQGRTEKGRKVTNAQRWQSLHNYGLAIDVFFMVEGKASWDDNLFLQLWFAATKAGLDRQGLHWSGLFTGSLRESAHFQYKKQDWREHARANGIDPITLNPIKPKPVTR
jgi:peptidoglycan L-alanyl-D-glutamate endopeptidase CwlK